MSKFMLYTDKNNDFRWKFAASNDKVVARSSEGFRSKDDCIKSLELLQKEITGATVDPTVQTQPTKGFVQGGNVPAAPLPAIEASAAGSKPAVQAHN